MRRIFTTAVAIALMGGAALSAPAVAADQGRPPRPTRARPPVSRRRPRPSSSRPSPPCPTSGSRPRRETLATARRVLSGKALPRDPSATLALRDLWMKKSSLRGKDRRLANALLARPTDGASDRPGLRLPRPRGRSGVQHPHLRPLRRHRRRRSPVGRLARPEPRGHGLGLVDDRRPARLPRAPHRRGQGRRRALRRLPQGPRRRHLRLLRRRDPRQEAHRLRLLRPRQRLRRRAVPHRHARPTT